MTRTSILHGLAVVTVACSAVLRAAITKSENLPRRPGPAAYPAEMNRKFTDPNVDIQPAFVKYIAEQARRHGHERVVKTVLNTPDSAELPAGSIDVAFTCDTYHHFEHPDKMLASIHRALRPGGRLVVIDFDLRKDSGEFVKQRARAAKEVYYREITAAGFELIEPKGAPPIKDNFFAEFRRLPQKSQAQP